jgi:hypothetical protein
MNNEDATGVMTGVLTLATQFGLAKVQAEVLRFVTETGQEPELAELSDALYGIQRTHDESEIEVAADPTPDPPSPPSPPSHPDPKKKVPEPYKLPGKKK